MNRSKALVVCLVAFGMAFIINFAAIRYCEHLNRCDSIGVWYTVYGATINAVLFTLALGGVVVVLKAIRRRVKADA